MEFSSSELWVSLKRNVYEVMKNILEVVFYLVN